MFLCITLEKTESSQWRKMHPPAPLQFAVVAFPAHLNVSRYLLRGVHGHGGLHLVQYTVRYGSVVHHQIGSHTVQHLSKTAPRGFPFYSKSAAKIEATNGEHDSDHKLDNNEREIEIGYLITKTSPIAVYFCKSSSILVLERKCPMPKPWVLYYCKLSFPAKRTASIFILLKRIISHKTCGSYT
jgi:hypothetical protein